MVTLGIAYIDAKFSMGYEFLYIGTIIIDCVVAENIWKIFKG